MVVNGHCCFLFVEGKNPRDGPRDDPCLKNKLTPWFCGGILMKNNLFNCGGDREMKELLSA
jgi:hypothetical protein